MPPEEQLRSCLGMRGPSSAEELAPRRLVRTVGARRRVDAPPSPPLRPFAEHVLVHHCAHMFAPERRPSKAGFRTPYATPERVPETAPMRSGLLSTNPSRSTLAQDGRRRSSA